MENKNCKNPLAQKNPRVEGLCAGDLHGDQGHRRMRRRNEPQPLCTRHQKDKQSFYANLPHIVMFSVVRICCKWVYVIRFRLTLCCDLPLWFAEFTCYPERKKAGVFGNLLFDTCV
ncbi:hypothetical protein CEXT_811721 [Caerostris extrusa]|uniref:Uncharacterized protein n=1 Tax=Caerostris extrusa TaxID=172846 RepID=A0AAV4TWN9_CAEEX|nr:hypothetical protein CEXT_811721 [Caerostris extrusa]